MQKQTEDHQGVSPLVDDLRKTLEELDEMLRPQYRPGAYIHTLMAKLFGITADLYRRDRKLMAYLEQLRSQVPESQEGGDRQ